MYTQANTQANTQSRYSKQILKANTLAGKLPLSPGEIAPCAPGDPLVPPVKTQKNKTSNVILYSYWGRLQRCIATIKLQFYENSSKHPKKVPLLFYINNVIFDTGWTLYCIRS